MKKLLILLFFAGFNAYVYAQGASKDLAVNNIRHQLVNYIDYSPLKDAVGLYTFAIEVKLKRHGNKYMVVSYCVNDTMPNRLYKSLDFINNIDYSALVKNEESPKLIIPVAIIVANFKNRQGKPALEITSLTSSFYQLFNLSNQLVSEPDNIYLQPTVIYTDTTVYD